MRLSCLWSHLIISAWPSIYSAPGFTALSMRWQASKGMKYACYSQQTFFFYTQYLILYNVNTLIHLVVFPLLSFNFSISPSFPFPWYPLWIVCCLLGKLLIESAQIDVRGSGGLNVIYVSFICHLSAQYLPVIVLSSKNKGDTHLQRSALKQLSVRVERETDRI